MRVDLFDFNLPEDRIALRPASPRDAARMLVVDDAGLHDRGVGDLPLLLRAGDCLVFNDTRVIPALLTGKRGDATIGATLHKREGLRGWRAFLKNARRVRDGDRVFHTYSVFGRGAEMTGGSYYFLDLTALGRSEAWEEPKDRSDDERIAVPDFAR